SGYDPQDGKTVARRRSGRLRREEDAIDREPLLARWIVLDPALTVEDHSGALRGGVRGPVRCVAGVGIAGASEGDPAAAHLGGQLVHLWAVGRDAGRERLTRVVKHEGDLQRVR